jgi:Trp operon repressor
MAHVTKEPIETTLFSKLFKELQILMSKTNTDSAEAVLSALLTPTEQIMLTKRFAVILFLDRGLTTYEIWHILKMSPSTVARIQSDYSRGAFDPIVKVFKHSAAKDFLALLEVILSAGLPPRTKDRWQSVPGFGRQK